MALKIIKPEIASDKETIERFSNELKLAHKIGHRNVGRMYELLEDEGLAEVEDAKKKLAGLKGN